MKLVGLLGLLAGFLGATTAFLAMTVAFTTAAAYVLVRRVVRHGEGPGRRQTVPLGPALLFGTLVAVIVS